MLTFMEYVLRSWSEASQWNADNSYASLNTTARALLDLPTPTGLSLALSSLSSSSSAASYTLHATGNLSGSLAYLYSSLPLSIPHASATLPTRTLIPGYQALRPLRRPDEPWWWEVWHGGRRVDRRDALLYGRLELPSGQTEALYLRRLSPTSQLRLAAVSSRTEASMLILLAQDYAKYATEYLLRTDGALLGVRGLYNFGPDPRQNDPYAEIASIQQASVVNDGTDPTKVRSRVQHGRFSAGAEVYYGLLNKSGGMSAGLRFATLPSHAGFPYTMTLTLNPLVGSLSSTYAVRASSMLSLCSRFDFNVYSYESACTVGLELWRLPLRSAAAAEASPVSTPSEHAVALGIEPGLAKRPIQESIAANSSSPAVRDASSSPLIRMNDPAVALVPHEAGVLKACLSHEGDIRVLWEARFKELLYSLGLHVDFRQREQQIFRGVGLEIQYST